MQDHLAEPCGIETSKSRAMTIEATHRHALTPAALASKASGQRGNSEVRAHSASEDARERAGDTRPEPGSSARAGAVIHPAWVRVTHWVNVVAMVLMIGSGWEIYNASPLFPFVFPRSITLGGWLAGALL